MSIDVATTGAPKSLEELTTLLKNDNKVKVAGMHVSMIREGVLTETQALMVRI